MELGSSPDAMAKKFFIITVACVIAYIITVLLLMATGQGADSAQSDLDPAVEVPVFVAASE